MTSENNISSLYGFYNMSGFFLFTFLLPHLTIPIIIWSRLYYLYHHYHFIIILQREYFTSQHVHGEQVARSLVRTKSFYLKMPCSGSLILLPPMLLKHLASGSTSEGRGQNQKELSAGGAD